LKISLGKKILSINLASSTLKKNDENELRSTIAEYSKKISIQEINLIRLSRKYDSLRHDEQTLRDAYHKIEVSFAEKEAELHERLNELLAWKNKASSQLKILFNLQMNSVPVDDYRILRNQLEIYQQKYADIKLKEADYNSRIARLETCERDLFTKNELIRDLKEDLLESELEMEMIRRRLEDLDPAFKKYQQIFRQMVEIIKNKNLSPIQIFELMDRDKSGKLSRNEFESALINMQIPFSKSDLDILFMFLDWDGNGEIEYKEFLKRLKRSGVKMRSNEEHLVFKVYEAITKANLTLERAFELFDKDGDNLISKDDMVSTFQGMSFGVDSRTIEEFFAMANINGDGSINFDEFYRLFEKTIKDAFIEEKKLKTDELNWKMQLMIKMDEAIKASSLTLLDAFNIIDDDRSGKITFDEFKELFNKMGISLELDKLSSLFKELDKDSSGYVTFPEFQHYFNEAKRENERINRLKFIASKTENLRDSTLRQLDSDKELNTANLGMSDQQRMAMKIALLETREKDAVRKIEILNMKLSNLDAELKAQDKIIRDAQSENLKIKEGYYLALEREFKLQQKLEGAIPKDRAVQLIKLNEKLSLERSELKRNMITFKNLYESSVGQIKILKLALEKKKNEVEVFQNTIKDLQALSDEAALVGKLQHELMLSKWNEGVANKKYETALDENRQLKIELQSFEAKFLEKEDEVVSIHNAYREKVAILEKNLADAQVK